MVNKNSRCLFGHICSQVIDARTDCAQVLTYNGFYDSNLEFVGLEGVQIVASMNAGNSLGRHKLTTRFSSIVRICSIGCVEICFNFPTSTKKTSLSVSVCVSLSKSCICSLIYFWSSQISRSRGAADHLQHVPETRATQASVQAPGLGLKLQDLCARRVHGPGA